LAPRTGRLHAHSGSRRQPLVRGLSPSRQSAIEGPLRASPAHHPGGPARLFQRHRDAGRAGRPPHRALPWRDACPHPALCGGGLHLLPPVSNRPGAALAPRAGVLVGAGGPPSLPGVGGAVSWVVSVVIAATKFSHGAWIVVLLIPVMVTAFRVVNRHYEALAAELSLEHLADEPPVTNTVLVLVGDLHMGVVRALRFAQSLTPNPKAVYVEIDPSRTLKLEERWAKGGSGVPLVVLASPYRSVLGPLFEYLGRIKAQEPHGVITIVIPEFVPRHWWQHVLHNQTALLVKGALLFRQGIVVVDV